MTPGAALRQVRDLLQLPVVGIEMRGDAKAKGLYRSFTERYARWRVIQNRAWGVALLEIPASPDAYDSILSKHWRRQIKIANKAGMTCRPFVPLDHVDEILAINRSRPERQGQAIHPHYLDEARVREFFATVTEADAMGAFDSAGVLRGYLTTRECGEVVVLERVLGHADALSTGLMYQLFSAAVGRLTERRVAGNPARWFMYDSFPGATPGMRSFKTVVGFRPYRVRWRWRDA
jgi:hypothetical protein